jgi:hypothetical protein
MDDGRTGAGDDISISALRVLMTGLAGVFRDRVAAAFRDERPDMSFCAAAVPPRTSTLEMTKAKHNERRHRAFIFIKASLAN